MNRYYAKIRVSHNELVKDPPFVGDRELREMAVLPLVNIYYRSPRAKRPYQISGFWVGETYHAYPLFNSHGHKEHRLTREEYNALVTSAKIKIDKYSDTPLDFEETVKSLEEKIRQDCTR